MDKIFGSTTVMVGLIVLLLSGLLVIKPFYRGRNILTVVAQIDAHASLLVTAVVILLQGIRMYFNPDALYDIMSDLFYALTELFVTLVLCLGVVVVDVRSNWLNYLDENVFRLNEPYKRGRLTNQQIMYILIGIVLLALVDSLVALVVVHVVAP